MMTTVCGYFMQETRRLIRPPELLTNINKSLLLAISLSYFEILIYSTVICPTVYFRKWTKINFFRSERKHCFRGCIAAGSKIKHLFYYIGHIIRNGDFIHSSFKRSNRNIKYIVKIFTFGLNINVHNFLILTQ